MNAQLEKIIMLQDLDLMISEVSDTSTASEEEKLGFHLDQVGTLQQARADLAEEIDGTLMAHYNKLHERYKRAVVPVKSNVCLACFLKQPTQYSVEQKEIRTCDHCSRILYLL